MKVSKNQSIGERRKARRLPDVGSVELKLSAQSIHGKAQNLSDDGLYVLADLSLRVEVHIAGEKEARKGKLIRLEARREGETGIAVIFDKND